MDALKLERTVDVRQGNPIFTYHPIAPMSLLKSCALLEIKLMIGLFTVFEVMEPQENYMEEFYCASEYKLIWMLCCYFSGVERILYISNMPIL